MSRAARRSLRPSPLDVSPRQISHGAPYTGAMDHIAAGYPQVRLRRLRRTPALRRAFAEVRLDPSALVAPLFVKDGIDAPVAIGAMPGVQQHTRDSVRAEAKRLHALG